MQQFQRYQNCTFLLVKQRVPQNAAISKISKLHLFTSKTESPPKCSNFEDIKIAPFLPIKKRVPPNAAISKISNLHLFTSKTESPPECSNLEDIKFAPSTDLDFRLNKKLSQVKKWVLPQLSSLA